MDKEKVRIITRPQIIADNIGFGEGPLWHKDGFLIFSELANNRIMKFENGYLEVFLEDSGTKGTPTEEQSNQRGSNGLAYDPDGNIILCQHGDHALSRLHKDGSIEVLVNSYKKRRLNSPNDLCVGSDGSIYFSDPPYGLKGQILHPEIAQPLAGVYRWYNNKLQLVSKDFHYPNGLCFSPDLHYLYISSAHPNEKKIRRYEVWNGTLHNGIDFAYENADGIKTCAHGNLYLAAPEGVVILSVEGKRTGVIELPEAATNLCLHNKELYITTATKLYFCSVAERY
jgi:gluconolactonase